jgi:hypothetical protein
MSQRRGVSYLWNPWIQSTPQSSVGGKTVKIFKTKDQVINCTQNDMLQVALYNLT